MHIWSLLLNAQARHVPCKSAPQGSSCWNEVQWAMTDGIRQHPEWYPGLNANSPREQFQEVAGCEILWQRWFGNFDGRMGISGDIHICIYYIYIYTLCIYIYIYYIHIYIYTYTCIHRYIYIYCTYRSSPSGSLGSSSPVTHGKDHAAQPTKSAAALQSVFSPTPQSGITAGAMSCPRAPCAHVGPYANGQWCPEWIDLCTTG